MSTITAATDVRGSPDAALVAARESSAGVTDALTLLPENPRFFQYKGKPLLSVTYLGEGGMPNLPKLWTRSRLEEAARHGNHIYLVAYPAWVMADFKTSSGAYTGTPMIFRPRKRRCGWIAIGTAVSRRIQPRASGSLCRQVGWF